MLYYHRSSLRGVWRSDKLSEYLKKERCKRMVLRNTEKEGRKEGRKEGLKNPSVRLWLTG